MSRSAGGVRAAILSTALVVAACGGAGSMALSSATATATSAAAPGSAAPSPTQLAVPSLAIPSSAPGASLALPSGATVSRDPTLLAILPSTVGGVAVTEEPQSYTEAVTDPAFVASVDRAAFGIAASANDLASGVVAHLRPGVYSDAMFADWRASYDDGACAQAGGVVAHAERDQGGRAVYVTTCGGGLRVYHTHLAAEDVIVSLFSTGPADLGAQLMAGIRG